MSGIWTADSATVTADSTIYTADGGGASGQLVMPNLVGMELIPATNALQAAGILVPAFLINLEWPIQVSWVRSAQPYGIVLAQNPVIGNVVNINGAISLIVSQYPLGIAYP